MYKSFFLLPEHRKFAWFGFIFLIIIIGCQVYISTLINSWYKDFYNILQTPKKYGLDQFWSLILQFSKYAFIYVLIATFANYFARIYTFRWREAMTFYYIPFWKNIDKDIEGSSQRLQEDTYRFAKIIESLGFKFVKSLMYLIVFIPVLWHLSGKITVGFVPWLNNIDGIFVYVALITSLGGMTLSFIIGMKLPQLEYNNQKEEAKLRKELVYAEDDKVKYGDHETLFEIFTGLKLNYKKIFNHYGYFDLWINMYSQSLIIVPYLFAAPSLFAGTIMLGTVIQVSNAFAQVHGSFAFLIDNWTTITELQSIHKRLKEFEHNIFK